MQRIKDELPSIVLEIVDVPSADLTKLVLQGRIDFSISPDQQPLNGLSHEPLLREELLLLTSAAWKLPRRKPRMSDIATMPMILPSLPNTLRSRVDHAFLAAGCTANLYAEASTAAILIPAVRMGVVATILPYSAAHPEITDGTIRAHSTEMPLSRELALCASNSLAPTPAVQKVMALCRQEVMKLIQSGVWRSCSTITPSRN